MKNKGLNLFEILWFVAPVAVWFSYRPLIKLGQDSYTNYELSIAVIFVFIFAVSGLPLIWKHKDKLIKMKEVLLTGSFVLLSALSIIWSQNQARGILTFGIIGILYLIFLASLANRTRLIKILPTITNIFIASAVVMSVLSFIQVILSIWLERDQALLCRACGAVQFGFARPNVFAIEPQFFANMLLAPALIMSKRLSNGKFIKNNIIISIIIFSALFLTLSRGAIIAFAIGFILLIILAKTKAITLIKLSTILLISFFISLLTQGFAAALNPKLNTTFISATSSSINQLSMGVIDLPTKDNSSNEVKELEVTASNPLPEISKTNKTETIEFAPNFNGYVEESTNVRLTLSKLSIEAWASSIERTFIGVGLGGSGTTLRQDFPDKVNDREIVQNQYIETLLENGLIGALLFISIIVGLIYSTRRYMWLWAIIAAHLVQWNFFSGYPNALHIYLVFILIFIYSKCDRPRKINN